MVHGLEVRRVVWQVLGLLLALVVLGIVVCLDYSSAHAITCPGVNCSPFPSNPMTIIGLQGRPIPRAVVSVTDLQGIPVTVYNDLNGSAFPGVVPPSTVLQFFTTEPGVYIVTAQGEGLTRRYYTTTGIGVGNTGTISIDRTAEILVTSVPVQLVLTCSDSGNPCYLAYGKDNVQTAMFDFIMPTFPVVFKTLLYSWFANPAMGVAVWSVDWCTYAVGDSICHPEGNNTVSKPSVAQSINTRNDVTFTVNDLAPAWTPGGHVVVFVQRQVLDGRDNIMTDIFLENVRLELERQ